MKVSLVSSENNYKDIVRRLDAVLAVLLETGSAEGKRIPVAKQVEVLDRAGLRPAEIARILRKNRAYVNVELHRLRRSQERR